MSASTIRLVLLPGLDGTGELFEPLRTQLPADLDVVTVSYPRDQVRSYAELRPFVLEACEGARSIVLFAESFSSPLAIEIAASDLVNLSGLILCAGFAAPPIGGLFGKLLRNLPLSLTRLSAPDWAIRRYLVGRDASDALTQRVKQTVASIPARVLRNRLNEVLTYSAMEFLPRVKASMLYIQASDDRLVPSTAFEAIASANPKAMHHLMNGPHLLAQANPSSVATAVVNFIHTVVDNVRL